MSWISGLANKAESLLNTLDSSAAEALTSSLKRDSPFDTFPDERFSVNNWDQSDRRKPRSSESVRIFESVTPADISFKRPIFSRPPNCQDSNETSELIDQKVNPPINPGLSEHDDSDPFSILLEPADDFYSGNQQNTAEYSAPSELSVAESSGYGTVSSFPTSTPSADAVIIETVKTASSDEVKQRSTGRVIKMETMADTKLENKLLRSEISSLNREISDLLRRNQKGAEENKVLSQQVDRLTGLLQDSDKRVRELQINVKELDASLAGTQEELSASLAQSTDKESTIKLAAAAEAELNDLRMQLESKQSSLTNVEACLLESRRQNQLSERRAELTQKESVRLMQELSQYKEKAAHILQMKERLIATLRGELNSDDSSEQQSTQQSEFAESVDAKLIASLRAECDMLREECARWRLEVDHREVSMQELDVQCQAERESFRRDLDQFEQQVLREKQLREDSDTELIQIRRKCRDLEECFNRQKTEWNSQRISAESELARLRKTVVHQRQRFPSEDSSDEPSELTRTDPEHVFTLESRIRQLTDALMSRQESLDSVLAQNHALKIRLDRAQMDNESLAAAVSTHDDLSNKPLLQTTGYGCARLSLQSTPIPRLLHPFSRWLDGQSIRVTNLFRRLPVFRLLFLLYVLILHIWMLVSTIVIIPPVQSQSPNPPPPPRLQQDG